MGRNVRFTWPLNGCKHGFSDAEKVSPREFDYVCPLEPFENLASTPCNKINEDPPLGAKGAVGD
jgi:hypothetical protein